MPAIAELPPLGAALWALRPAPPPDPPAPASADPAPVAVVTAEALTTSTQELPIIAVPEVLDPLTMSLDRLGELLPARLHDELRAAAVARVDPQPAAATTAAPAPVPDGADGSGRA
ncbi:hypothetical protein [Micromonospora sp. RTGN7]|uniref:hypothetical protein n=1 Tax=Micromonospora sp. RTGN7 TaxID=3016526 RepID=UPI0029FF0C35|nr:hypothetical protein [Micromonospora sp. RTGN7]